MSGRRAAGVLSPRPAPEPPGPHKPSRPTSGRRAGGKAAAEGYGITLPGAAGTKAPRPPLRYPRAGPAACRRGAAPARPVRTAPPPPPRGPPAATDTAGTFLYFPPTPPLPPRRISPGSTHARPARSFRPSPAGLGLGCPSSPVPRPRPSRTYSAIRRRRLPGASLGAVPGPQTQPRRSSCQRPPRLRAAGPGSSFPIDGAGGRAGPRHRLAAAGGARGRPAQLASSRPRLPCAEADRAGGGRERPAAPPPPRAPAPPPAPAPHTHTHTHRPLPRGHMGRSRARSAARPRAAAA